MGGCSTPRSEKATPARSRSLPDTCAGSRGAGMGGPSSGQLWRGRLKSRQPVAKLRESWKVSQVEATAQLGLAHSTPAQKHLAIQSATPPKPTVARRRVSAAGTAGTSQRCSNTSLFATLRCLLRLRLRSADRRRPGLRLGSGPGPSVP